MCDTSTSLDNTGFMKFDCDIEMEANVFNTSNSNLWVKLRRVFAADIEAHYALMRQSRFTEENIMKYLYDEQISQIPEILYNRDAQTKYLDFGAQYLYACHGSREQQIKRWIHERLLFMDSLMNYTVSGSDFITVRANKLGYVYFDIQVFSPQYFSIKFRDEANNTGLITKRVGRGETVRFDYNLPTATDQEIVIYYGRNIKDLGDMTNLQPTTLLLGNATRLTRVICSSQYLINASISDCKMLQHIDLHDSVLLGTGEGAQQTLDVSACTNLKYINIYGTQLTALYTNTSGGNIEEIYYPYSIQTVIVQNQPRLKSIGIPIYYTGKITNEDNIYADKLVDVNIVNCDNVTSLVTNYYDEMMEVPIFIGVSRARFFSISNSLLNAEKIDLSHSSNMESLTLDSMYQLREINFDDISPYNAQTSNLSNVVITNCPNVETLTFNQNTIDGEDSLGVAFATGMTLDLSNLYNLKTIRSNVGVKGLTKLIVPKSVTTLVFDYPSAITYTQTNSDILNIWSVDCNHEEDNFTGIDLLNMDVITDFSMGSLTRINNAINLNIKITNTFPYFNYFKTDDYFKPEGTVDISEYRGSLDSLFKGVDLNKLNIICTEPLPHTSAKHMFAFATAHDVDVLNRLFELMPNVIDFSYMFYNGFLTHAPYIPLRAQNVSYMFYGNATMISTPSNWTLTYPIVPLSDYCYTGCVGITTIDDKPGSIDVIPTNWGGYDRENITVSGEYLEINNTLEREFTLFTAAGQTLHNIVPEIGQTEIVTTNKLSQDIGEGLTDNILISDGSIPYGVLEGLTLVNLASERRSGLLKTSQETHLVSSIVNENFKTDTEKPLPIMNLEGRTLINLAPKGETPLLSDGGKETYRIDNTLSQNVVLDNRKMISSKIYGDTIKNLVTSDTNRTPLLTLDQINPSKQLNDIIEEMNSESGKNIRVLYDEPFKSAILCGSTKYKDVDTDEILETFEEGRNLELVSVKMPVLTTSNEDGTKTNILTVNEEVELRGIGDVQDELDCLTGEVTQRIGEIVFDGGDDEEWNAWLTEDTMIVWTLPKSFVNLINPISDRYIGSTAYGKTEEMFAVHSDDTRHIQLRLFKTTARNINELKIYLQSNPITVKYVLESPTIKTVDLTINNEYGGVLKEIVPFENGHISVSSDVLTPILEYRMATNNYFELPSLQSNTTYTLRYDGTNTNGYLGGSTFNARDNMTLTTQVTDNSLYINDFVNEVMLLNGDCTNKDVPYFNDEPSKSVNATEIIVKPTGQPVFGKGGKK